jgi:adenosylhomocysteine nucleosidase
MIVLAAAERIELAGFLRRTRKNQRLNWPIEYAARAQHRGLEYVLIANGAGPRLAARAVGFALAENNVEIVVSVGFCGALDPALRPLDVFLATSVEVLELKIRYTLQLPTVTKRCASGVLASVDRVARTVEEKAELRSLGAAAVEMEAAGVAGEAYKAGVPCAVVRVVTDTAAESFHLDFNRLRLPDGAFDRKQIVRAALRAPLTGIPELARLARRSRAASERLGEILADCRF